MKNQALIATRKQLGKTQSQVAVEVGIAKQAYQRYEQGKVIPNVIIANRISKSLETDSVKLWGYESSKAV